jgi:hypothetical protein
MTKNTKSRIEAYVRHSFNGATLNLHVAGTMRDKILQGIAAAAIDGTSNEIHLELSVLPQWVTDVETRRTVEAVGTPIHIRIPLDSINVVRDE